MPDVHYQSVKDTLYNYLRDHIRYGLEKEEVERMLEEVKAMIKEET